MSSLLSDFRSQIQSLGSQVQAAAHMTSVSGAGPASVELADTASARGGQGPEAGGVEARDAGAGSAPAGAGTKPEGLDVDPDLEAYLQARGGGDGERR